MTSSHWALWPISLVSPLGQWGFCPGIEWEFSKQGSVPREASIIQPWRCPDRSPILDRPKQANLQHPHRPRLPPTPMPLWAEPGSVGQEGTDPALCLLPLWSLLWNGGHILKPAMCSRRGTPGEPPRRSRAYRHP